jgi:hypothetical protein
MFLIRVPEQELRAWLPRARSRALAGRLNQVQTARKPHALVRSG